MSNLKSKYARLLGNPFEVFQQDTGGNLLEFDDMWSQDKSRLTYNVYPGSFNPLHEAHRAIFDLMPGNPGRDKVFEISLSRYQKSNLSCEELEERLMQFKGYAPVIVTNTATFLGKCTVLSRLASQIRFHVGVDTILRVKDHYGEIDMMAIPAYFEVYDRKTQAGVVEKFPSGFKYLPKNAMRASSQVPEHFLGVSSTKIRESSGN